jgi:micrococcal nuclease
VRSFELVLAAALAAAAISCEPDVVLVDGPDACRVEHVSDGDTIRVSCLDESVRLLLVDAPEVARGAEPAMCFGEEARDYLRERLPEGTEVRLEAGVLDRDRFDRYLRYVWLGGELINETLVSEGYATRYRDAEDTTYRDRIAAAEAAAEAQGLGVWSACADE